MYAIHPHLVILVPTRASLRPPIKPRLPTCGSREKVAGSNPVGHPPREFCLDKQDACKGRDLPGDRKLCWLTLTPAALGMRGLKPGLSGRGRAALPPCRAKRGPPGSPQVESAFVSYVRVGWRGLENMRRGRGREAGVDRALLPYDHQKCGFSQHICVRSCPALVFCVMYARARRNVPCADRERRRRGASRTYSTGLFVRTAAVRFLPT